MFLTTTDMMRARKSKQVLKLKTMGNTIRDDEIEKKSLMTITIFQG